ncbi:MAG: acyl-CoA thioesterase [Deltaproteobacteria bacterium]|nr:acyl-CoA thioesterase [Deltaproteobacteria bacterium]
MAHIKLTEQPEYEFHYKVTIRSTDINYRGHLGYDALVALFSEAGIDMFRSLGFRDSGHGDDKTGVAMADLTVNYKAEAFMFDELIIDTHVGELKEKGFTSFHRIRKGTDIVALAEAGLVSFDFVHHKVVPLPETFRQSLQEYKRRNQIISIQD